MNQENSKILHQLAKDKYGESFYAALWGSATALLTDEQAKIIKSILEN